MFGRDDRAVDTRYSRIDQFDSIDSDASHSSLGHTNESPKRRRPRLWYIGLGVALILAVILIGLFTTGHQAPSREGIEDGKLEDDEPHSEFYEWRTVSAFPTMDKGAVASHTLEELCALFPKHKLQDVQPVLKTGHGAMERVRHSLNSTSACLDNLLIFSDLDEDVEGHHVVDVIADIPLDMLTDPRIADQMQPYLDMKALAANGTLDDNQLTKIEGWKTDKFKFLPEISRAWRMAPERRWYVFYEGDTYMVWDTIFRLVQNFDADQPHYFGSPSPGRDGIWFGNGGPGYIISREAMRRLVKDDWNPRTGEWLGPKLLEKYWGEILGDCCGDSVLGWVLHEAGVDLKGLWPMFNPHPLQGVPFSHFYWCEPVLSMHKSDLVAEESFWRFEWDARSVDPQRPVLWRDLATSFWNITSFTDVREDWDNAGWDAYGPSDEDPYHPHNSPETCADACTHADDCFQWTYHLKRCTFVRSIRVGHAREPHVEKEHEGETWNEQDKKYISGWDIPNIAKWINDRPCEKVKWVRPSIERIF